MFVRFKPFENRFLIDVYKQFVNCPLGLRNQFAYFQEGLKSSHVFDVPKRFYKWALISICGGNAFELCSAWLKKAITDFMKNIDMVQVNLSFG